MKERGLDMADVIITITCPVCKKEFTKKAKELRDGTVIKCPGCGEKTTIRGNMFTDMVEKLKDERAGHA